VWVRASLAEPVQRERLIERYVFSKLIGLGIQSDPDRSRPARKKSTSQHCTIEPDSHAFCSSTQRIALQWKDETMQARNNR
jgi:hypothetical protein